MIQSIRGTRDIAPGELELWQYMENTAKNLLEDFGFSEIRIPIIEKTELFKRSIGEDTDIVEKEMYTFMDRGKESVTLRPEATASIVRSYIQHKMYASSLVGRLYTIGPMFRRERPQKGRYRQFYQIDAEIFGDDSAYADAQLIIILTTLMNRLSVKDVTTHINSLGCPNCRPDFTKAFKKFLESVLDKLCEDCKKRSIKNPLRVLDCKISSCRETLENSPALTESLCENCATHFEILKNSLTAENIPYKINNRLVRGLDYYTKTTFEIQTESLGAQSAIAGGGRYDGLVSLLEGPEIPATGFAIGFDRLAEIVAQNNIEHMKNLKNKPEIFIAPLGEKSIEKAFRWSSALNLSGIKCQTEFSVKSLKSLMRKADKSGAASVIICGDSELENGAVILRNMKTKEQIEIKTEDLVNNIKKIRKKND